MKKESMMKSIQPYFVMATPEYHKGIVMNYGILHFYDYFQHMDSDNGVIVVPDGCIDIMFEKDSKGVKARVAGTVLEKTIISNENNKEYFGVRFLPGEAPAILSAGMKEFVEKEINLEDVLIDKDFLKRIEESYDKGQWMQAFLTGYKEAFYKQLNHCEKGNVEQLAEYMKIQLIVSNGNISVKELAEKTGYTERYINKAFNQSMGISPKTFGMIIKFQKAIQKINQAEEDCKLTDIGVDAGYYDQAHFIRVFKKYAAVTPKEYQKMILANDYHHRMNAVRLV